LEAKDLNSTPLESQKVIYLKVNVMTSKKWLFTPSSYPLAGRATIGLFLTADDQILLWDRFHPPQDSLLMPGHDHAHWT